MKQRINPILRLRGGAMTGPVFQRVGANRYAYSGKPVKPIFDDIFKFSPDVFLDFSQASIAPQCSNPLNLSATFTRSSEGTVVDNIGQIVTVPANQPRFQGARYVTNLIPVSESMSALAGIWSVSNATLVNGLVTRTANPGSSITIAGYLVGTNTGSRTYAVRVSIGVSGSARSIKIVMFSANPTSASSHSKTISFAASATPIQYDVSFYTTISSENSTSHRLVIYDGLTGEGVIGDTAQINFAHVEEVVNQGANYVPDYVPNLSSTQSAIKAFVYLNGNTKDANSNVTTGKGLPILDIGFLNEPAVTNLLSNTAFTSWSPSAGGASTITPGFVSPSGQKTAILFSSTVAGVPSIFYTTTPSYVAGQKYRFSVYAKPGTANFLTFTGFGIGSQGPTINIITGEIKLNGSAWSDGTFEKLGNGWSRLSFAVVPASSTGYTSLKISAALTDLTNTEVPAGSSVYLWGPQVEAHTISQPSSYIRTAGATVTRAADNLSYSNGQKTTTLGNTYFMDGIPYFSGIGYNASFFGDAWRSQCTGAPFTCAMSSGNIGYFNHSTNTDVAGIREKIAIGTRPATPGPTNGFLAKDGQVLYDVLASGSFALSNGIGTLRIAVYSNTRWWPGVIYKAASFSRGLSNAELAELTSKAWGCKVPKMLPPTAELGPFIALDTQYWINPVVNQVLFDLFPPTGEPNINIAYADLPTALAEYPDYLAIIQAKISEIEGA